MSQIMALKQVIYGVRIMQISNKVIHETQTHETYYEGPLQIYNKESPQRQTYSHQIPTLYGLCVPKCKEGS